MNPSFDKRLSPKQRVTAIHSACRVLWELAVAVTLMATITPALAHAAEGRWAVYAGAEGHNDAERPAHGLVLVAWSARRDRDAAMLGVTLNTDTLRLFAGGLTLSDATTLSAQVTGEAFVAGLSTDYWRDGAHVAERTFRSSYAQAQVWTRTQLADALVGEVELGGRRWFFGPQPGETGAGFRLPDEAWVLEPRLRLTAWWLREDAGFDEPNRLFPRLRGVALGVEAGVDVRSSARPWGGDATTLDPRNHPKTIAARVRPWAMGGGALSERVRAQAQLDAGWARGDDDLTRRRVGGLTPYVAQVPGVFWAHDLADRYASALVSVPFALDDTRDVELGPLFGGAALTDPHRVGDGDKVGARWGAGLALDARLGAWQVDARAGYSPSLPERDSARAWTLYVGAGWVGSGG